MIKILFLIHDLGQGGAEKVLVNLVNNMDRTKFDITVMSLFGGGVNEQFLKPEIRYLTVFKKSIPGNSKIMKLLSPQMLHQLFIKEKYDIEVSYLEGPTARIISGCGNSETKTICWIHSNHFSQKEVTASFRSLGETQKCYKSFDKIVCVSKFMRENFCHWIPVREKCDVLYNTVDSDRIRSEAKAETPELIEDGAIRIIATGSLKEIKGFDRLLRIAKRLVEDGENIHLYILGKGPLRDQLNNYILDNALQEKVTLLGYQINPYRFVEKCDLFVCSSHSEGFSTAATEALILGTAVCTVDVSGMREMLGENNEYGIIVNNDEDSLYHAIKQLVRDRGLMEHYRGMAKQRGNSFCKEETVSLVEECFSLLND